MFLFENFIKYPKSLNQNVQIDLLKEWKKLFCNKLFTLKGNAPGFFSVHRISFKKTLIGVSLETINLRSNVLDWYSKKKRVALIWIGVVINLIKERNCSGSEIQLHSRSW